jgi:D-glycero-D-manno-heptose 1,7-bisphosphate phosphatase
MNKAVAAFGGRIDAIFYCPHSPDEGCRCRKPMPGLFEQIGDRFGVDLRTTHVVGDTPRDLQAGAVVGCQPHLVLTGKAESLRGHPLPDTYPTGTRVHRDLAAFADWLLALPSAPRPAA